MSTDINVLIKVKFNRFFSLSLFVFLCFFLSNQLAYSQEPKAITAPIVDETQSGADNSNADLDNDFDMLSSTPVSLAEMRLHEATFPTEASLRCGILDACILGLSRGFAIGIDASRMAKTFVLDPQLQPGAWALANGFLGFQFLDGVDKTFFANGLIGYRYMRYNDSNSNEDASKGLYGEIRYAQKISPILLLGMTFSGTFWNSNTVTQEARLYEANASGASARRALNLFYDFARIYPKFLLSFPVDVELINWKASHVDLPADLHGYFRGEPFFSQHEFTLPDGISWVERDFGSKFEAIIAYESTPNREVGRYAISSSVGFDVAIPKDKSEIPTASAINGYALPERSAFGVFASLKASWQF